MVLRNPFIDEEKEGFLGRMGSDHRGSSVMVFPSNPEIRDKGLSFMGNCGMMVVENMEVTPSSPSQSSLSSFPPSCGLALPFLSPSVPVLPSSVIQSQSPMENRVISEIFSKKDDDGTFCSKEALQVLWNSLAWCLSQMRPSPIYRHQLNFLEPWRVSYKSGIF